VLYIYIYIYIHIYIYIYIYIYYPSYIQRTPQKLSAGRKNHPGAPGADVWPEDQKRHRGRRKDPAAAGIERFFSLKGPRRERSSESSSSKVVRTSRNILLNQKVVEKCPRIHITVIIVGKKNFFLTIVLKTQPNTLRRGAPAALRPPWLSLNKILFHFKAIVWESYHPLSLHMQSLPFCNTIARPLRNIRPPTDRPCVCHTPSNIGDGNIV